VRVLGIVVLSLLAYITVSVIGGYGYAVHVGLSSLHADPGCRSQAAPVRVRVSVSKYPENWRHMVDARHGRNTAADGVHVIDNGLEWPTILTKNDVGERERREAGEKMSGLPARPGKARDEYPPAELRSTNAADFRYVDRRANSAQGASMGNQLRKWCNRQRVRLVAVP
jgi:hypothetical protein